MDFKFSKGGKEDLTAEPAGEKKKMSGFMILILVWVGIMLALLVFNLMSKPQEASKPADATQVVKMALPPRDGAAAKTSAKSSDEKKDAAVPPPAAPAQVAQAVPVTPSQPVAKPKEDSKKVEPAKSAAQPAAKPKEEARKAESAKPPVQPQAKPKEEPKKVEPVKAPVQVAAKPREETKRTEPVKVDTKKASAEALPKPKAPSEKSETAAKAEAKLPGSANTWSILVGSYVLEGPLATDMGRVRKAGFEPVIKPGAGKKSAMNRLFVSEFTDRADAQSALVKLKRHTSDAFIIDQAGKHTLYAGSYLLDDRAATEVERLSAAGYSVSLRRTEVSIPSRSLTLGPFNDKKAAETALGKLKAVGVKGTLTQK